MKKIVAFACLIILIVSVVATTLASTELELAVSQAVVTGTTQAVFSKCPRCGNYIRTRYGRWDPVPNPDVKTINGTTYYYYYESREVSSWCECGYNWRYFPRRLTSIQVAYTH